MRIVHRVLGTVALTVAITAGTAVLPAAQSQAQTANAAFKLDDKSCAALRDMTRALERQHGVPPRRVDCVVRVRTVTRTTTESALARVGVAPASAGATGCQGFWRSYSLAYWLSGQVNVGLCSNGSSTWSVWGPDCGVNMWPMYAWQYSTNVTWCGVYGNGARYVQPGENFHPNPYPTPWWSWYNCWVRFTAGPSGRGVGMNYGAGGC